MEVKNERRRTTELAEALGPFGQGVPLRHGRPRHDPLRAQDPRQHGAPVHPHHDGRPAGHPHPAALLLAAPAALRGATDQHLETAHAARARPD